MQMVSGSCIRGSEGFTARFRSNTWMAMRSGRFLKRRVLTLNAHEGSSETHIQPDELTSRKMRAVRQAGTSPEIAVRTALESLGIEFDTNVRGAPGSPDIWLTKYSIPIFVHGCFWHRHEGCAKATTPKRNGEFWLAKFQKNKERDARVIRQLEATGHAPIVVWQCETTTPCFLNKTLGDRLQALLKSANAEDAGAVGSA